MHFSLVSGLVSVSVAFLGKLITLHYIVHPSNWPWPSFRRFDVKTSPITPLIVKGCGNLTTISLL